VIRSLRAAWKIIFVLALVMVPAFGAQTGIHDRLLQAAKSGDAMSVSALVQQRIDVNAAEADGTTALHWAVRNDDLDIVSRLIDAGADVRASNRYGVTAIYLAALNGNAEIIEKLLNAGADANSTGTEGETALMTAARTGNVAAAKVLLLHGADVNRREQWRGQTALMWASAQGHSDMTEVLIARGADVNARSNVQRWERQNTAEPREKWLPPGGLTPLLFAAREGCVACIGVLVNAGADVNATDPEGIGPLLSALINGHYDAAAVLLERGANPNLADGTGRTALYAAVDFHTMPSSNRPAPKELDNERTSFDLIKALIAAGANVNAQLKSQQPYRTKLDRGDDTMLGAGTTPLLRAAKAGDVSVVRLLLELSADPNLTTRSGINPLMAAAGVGTKEEDTTGRFKTQADVIETIRLCLEAGVDINAAENGGRTAVYGAALQGFDDVVQFLSDHGAKLNVKDRQGRTPLDAAMGLAGGLGFDGSSSIPHESTAARIRQLLGK
jgi:ankyrin repeat protein